MPLRGLFWRCEMKDSEKLRYLRKKINRLNTKYYHLQKQIDKEHELSIYEGLSLSDPGKWFNS